MTFGSLFSGIDGFAEGLEHAGMELKWQVEINEYCLKILQQDWPNVPKYKDIRDVGKHNLQAVDLICGGFPCQPFSVAGKRRGKADDRYLWPEMLRVISEIKPSWVFAENVPGILHIDDGLVIEQVLSSLEDEGYETLPPLVIPACAVDAPHRRDRVWIVAYGDRQRRQQKPKGSSCHESQDERRAEESNYESTGDGEGSRAGTMADTEASIRRWPGNEEYTGRRNQEIRGCGITGGRVQHWPVEPGLGRVASRIPNRKNRLEALGNAVVPQLVEMIGRAIMQAEYENTKFIESQLQMRMGA